MKLIPNARQAWKLWSMRLLAIAIALPEAWATLVPDSVKQSLPPNTILHVTAVLTIGAAIARVIQQNLPQQPPAAPVDQPPPKESP